MADATRSAYAKVQLLDNLNNAITPLVDIDSIYKHNDLDNKSSIGTLPYATVTNQMTQGQIENIDFSTQNLILDLTLDTNHNIVLTSANLDAVLSAWYEKSYLGKQSKNLFVVGLSSIGPNDSNINNLVVEIKQIVNQIASATTVSKTAYHHAGVSGFAVYETTDYNSTNFQSFEERGLQKRVKLCPSNAYIWVAKVKSDMSDVEARLYGFSGEDSPQEIDLRNVDSAGIWVSVGKFGVDIRMNASDSIIDDGVPYSVFVTT